jgi:riboflavin synthase
MFTGLVQALGRVHAVEPSGPGARLIIDPRGWSHHPSPGDSIAVNGCCLTLVHHHTHDGLLRFDTVRQTLDMTALGLLRPGDPVNLEHSVTAATLMGGHFVQGHIDGVGEFLAIKPDPLDWRVTLRPPSPLLEYIIPQGSIAIDGVSLTIAAVRNDTFEVALIPTTLERTNLGSRRVGDRCNLESDILARTVVHWLSRRSGG